jgi:two-component system, response regulator PdtaR
MGRPNILIVEDETITAMDIQMQLRDHGYRSVDFVTTGEEAVEYVENEKVGLLLMDVKLKGVLDGIRTVKRIQEKQRIPVVYISGNTDRHISHRMKATKPVGIINKPLHEEQLLRCVEGALKPALRAAKTTRSKPPANPSASRQKKRS